jgi:DNA primase large subunit|tara:strand:+ start:2437 stop:3615 length:1179 start_codon:yes stop_codon:yes gene_type:complete
VPTPLEPPEIEENYLFARYPFLPQAKEWLNALSIEENITLQMLIEDPFMEPARTRGMLRLIEMIEHSKGVDMESLSDIYTRNGQLMEAYSYLFAKLIICSAADEILVSRWAQAEAELAEKRLSVEGEKLELIARTYVEKISHEKNEFYRPKIWDGKGIRLFGHKRGIWKIGLIDFIELCPNISGSRWRLANHEIEQGWITLTDEENYCSDAQLSRLLREKIKVEIQRDVREQIEKLDDKQIPGLENHVKKVIETIGKFKKRELELSMVDQEDWPPCMHKAITELARGVNVNHTGRFFLASMASKLALPQKDAVAFFNNAPDFSESITSYQIGQIYEMDYTPTSCEKMKLGANCAVEFGDDSLCDKEWLKNPVQYVAVKQGWKGKKIDIKKEN